MCHLLMNSDRFDIEGLVSSPSYGKGNKGEILRMIGLYEKDLPQLKKHSEGYPSPDYLRSITKQGHHGLASYIGYSTASEGSNWIIKCAEKKSSQPLWVLVWGGLDDLAQALHDAPDIQNKIRVYWIGGPNKKWSANSYAYIVANFPNLWFIEDNSSYYGFFSNIKKSDSVKNSTYYDKYIQGRGYLGKDFKNYYNGVIKMGDTPSLCYMMDGNPNNPMRESWGGSFDRLNSSPRVVYNHLTNITDTVAFCTIVEFHFKGPKVNVPADSICFWMYVSYNHGSQKWPGYYLGNGEYAIKYVPKKAEVINYYFVSNIPNLVLGKGKFVAANSWPGKWRHSTDYKLGNNWFTDKSDPSLYDGDKQGGKTISKWRVAILLDWAKRWDWLSKN